MVTMKKLPEIRRKFKKNASYDLKFLPRGSVRASSPKAKRGRIGCGPGSLNLNRLKMTDSL